MSLQKCQSGSSPLVILTLVLACLPISAFGYGSPGPMAAAFGENGFFCAIDAGGKQEIICWGRGDNFSVSSSSASMSTLPLMASLSVSEGLICGITSNISQPFCFNLSNPGTNLVPRSFQYNAYSQIARGRNHAYGIRGSFYSGTEYGSVDCWEFNRVFGSFQDSRINSPVFKRIVAGDGFSCGVIKEGGVVCVISMTMGNCVNH